MFEKCDTTYQIQNSLTDFASRPHQTRQRTDPSIYFPVLKESIPLYDFALVESGFRGPL